MEKRIEVLAPAGSMESLKAAISAGADAVYTGGTMFGARAYANNLSAEELLEAIDYVHLHGKSLYLTVNTLLKEREIQDKLYDYLLPYYCQGLDAVIVQDIGVLKFIREKFPDLPIHASTQMTIAGVEGARLLEQEGAQRVVTARELSIQEVEKIAKETNLEIESFVHGALCYCYSGQCLFSSFLGGRSGNRGQCAQPCRLQYRAEGEKKNSYILSLKDICTLELIPEMVEAGIDSFKIEGRMKKPEYVAAVTKMYRKYTDRYLELRKSCPPGGDVLSFVKRRYRVDEKDRNMLLDLYNRGGFHTGYYHTRNGKEMISFQRPNHAGIPAVEVKKKQGRNIQGTALIDLNPQDIIELPLRKGKDKADNYTCKNAVKRGETIQIPVFSDTPFEKGMIWNRTRNEKLIQDLHESFVDRKIKEKLNGKFILSVGDSAKLTVSCGKISVTVYGDGVQEAKNQPMDAERISRQLKKTGNTEFEFDQLDIEINGNVFLPMQSLNEIRREALEQIEQKICGGYRREKLDVESDLPAEMSENSCAGPRLTASAQSMQQIELLIDSDLISRIYVDCVSIPRIWEGDGIRKIIEKSHHNQKEIYLIMPYIFREDTRVCYEKNYEKIFGEDWDGVLIRNYESFGFLKTHGFVKPIITDYNLYQFNSLGQRFWKEKGVQAFTAPLELTAQEVRTLDMTEGEVVIYGHLPMMVSAGCVKKSLGKCRKESGKTTITDRYRKEFVVKNECDYCYNVIYNQVPLYLADLMDEVLCLKAARLRLMFTVEDAKKTKEILALYERMDSMPDGEFTRGHWKKGIK